MVYNLEQNKGSAQAFYQLAFDGNLQQTDDIYVGEMYIQHNPLVGDGPTVYRIFYENGKRILR